MGYKIIKSTFNKRRTNSSTPPKSWGKSKQAYWSDIGKQARITSYKKNRDTRRTDNKTIDHNKRLKKFRFKLKVISSKGKPYTRYIYRKIKNKSTINRYKQLI